MLRSSSPSSYYGVLVARFMTMKVACVSIAALAVVIGVVDGQEFNFGGGGQPAICKPYTCPNKEQVPVPKWPLNFESSGCSSLGGLQMMVQGQNGANDPTEICCDQRTACIQTCGSIKMTCDEIFFRCCQEKCRETSLGNPQKEEQCLQTLSIHKMMIGMAQCTAYDERQQSNCECVDEDQAEQKRLEVITKFYEQHSPESVDKAAGLVKKAETPKKMANLLTKLVKKYPKSIKKVKDANQQMYDEIVNKSRKRREEKEKEYEDEDDSDDDDDSEREEL
jgi:Group XII secretory phospholipase A2 precursor (PLA2G12)